MEIILLLAEKKSIFANNKLIKDYMQSQKKS